MRQDISSRLIRYTAMAVLPVLLCAQGSFQGLGTPNTYLGGISADGSAAVGALNGEVFRWTAATGVVRIGGTGTAARISRDGKTIVSEARNAQAMSEAAIWISGSQWKTIGNLGAFPTGETMSISTPLGVSMDGSVVVGLAWPTAGSGHAFRWDQANGMVDLGSLQGRSTRANAVSGDGNVIVGWDDDPYAGGYAHNPWRAVVWWQGTERLLHPYGWVGEAKNTNHNGTAVVGRGHPSSYRHAYLWTPWEVLDLGSLPRGFTPNQQELEDQSMAWAVSDDGAVVVGDSGHEPPLDGFVWTRETQMMRVAAYLRSKGVTGFDGWQLTSVCCLSPNGKIIAGVGLNPSGASEGYIVRLP